MVLENVLDHAVLDALNQRMVADARVLQSAGENSPYNYNKGNIQQDPPLVEEYFSSHVFLNPLARQVVSSILGPRTRLSFISGNTALPPTRDAPPQSQPVHSDADFDHPTCPFAIVVNIPLVDMTVENGSTEVWLGTHASAGISQQEGAHGERASGRIKQSLLDERRATRPPTQPLIKKGSVVLRDLRLWHAGKPNFSTDVRVMLAMIHFAQWYRNPMRVAVDEGLKPILERDGGDLQIHSNFMPAAAIRESYLKGKFGNAYDFDQMDRLEDLF
ncbi:MAG: hypothetical protein M1822_010080 [Bathelium mastoideum]|nr:MAG: hypothetical protein M1822_010080 [Bathelium mastoideum]